jgi:hypothetical protein
LTSGYFAFFEKQSDETPEGHVKLNEIIVAKKSIRFLWKKAGILVRK